MRCLKGECLGWQVVILFVVCCVGVCCLLNHTWESIVPFCCKEQHCCFMSFSNLWHDGLNRFQMYDLIKVY